MRVVKAALVEKYILSKWDPEGDTVIWLKQVKQAEDIRRQELFARTVIERTPGNALEHVSFPVGELMFLECFLSYDDSTIQWEVPIDPDKPDKGLQTEPMFPKGLSESEFRRRFARIDPALADEWQELAREQNPQWKPRMEVQGN